MATPPCNLSWIIGFNAMHDAWLCDAESRLDIYGTSEWDTRVCQST